MVSRFTNRMRLLLSVAIAALVFAGDTTAQDEWRAEWDKVVRAANQEGRLVISGIGAPSYRNVILSFQKDYPDITVEYVGGKSTAFWPRLLEEKSLGQHNWDVRVGGGDPLVYQAAERGYLAPVKPLFLLPDVRHDGKWRGGMNHAFADEARKYVFSFFAQTSPPAAVNRDLVSEAALPGADRLVDPSLRGKIAILNPQGSSGLSALTTFLVGYGEDFLRQLLSKQDLVVSNDQRQIAEWMIRGRYAVGIGVPGYVFLEFQKHGLGKNVEELQGPKRLSMAGGGIQVFDSAPHPNAAKVFVNWLLTKDVQEKLSKSTNYNSRRADVPPSDLGNVYDVELLDQYLFVESEAALPHREAAAKLASELLK